MKYTAVNIGPILSTLSLARRPRELWAASYLFSYLMECIIASLPDKKQVISPAFYDRSSDIRVGLYPDRLFIRGEVDQSILEKAWAKFNQGMNLSMDYFKLMHVICEASSDREALQKLNLELDKLELFNFASTEDVLEKVNRLLQKREDSPLFYSCWGSGSFPVETLGEIAGVEKAVEKERWGKFKQKIREENITKDPYRLAFANDFKSYHKYICVVQADGDNVGKTLTHPSLKDEMIRKISEALLVFGNNASSEITNYGGLPIYAGGDDLLFIAPVVGKDGVHIFSLLEKLDKCFSGVSQIVSELGLCDENGQWINASLSYGLSIAYYKYPLYEILQDARKQLFVKAKGSRHKNTISWQLQKHSGGCLGGMVSKNVPEFLETFYELIDVTHDGNLVSVVAHKIRENARLLEYILETGDKSRMKAFFDKFLEANQSSYFQAVGKMAVIVYDYVHNEMGEVEILERSKAFQTILYSLLRTAKFIKGEDPIDE